MLGTLIQIVGPWFFLAVAIEALAVLVEQWGAVRSPEEEPRKHNALALLALILTILTPGLLIAHGVITTRGADESFMMLAIGAPIVAVLLGALLGAIAGASVRGAAPLMRKLALPLDLVAFVVAIFAVLSTIQGLIQSLQSGGAAP